MFILFCASATLAKNVPRQSIQNFEELTFSDVVSMFEAFMVKYQRNYKDLTETAMRFRLFVESLKRTSKKNRDHGTSVFGTIFGHSPSTCLEEGKLPTSWPMKVI